MGRLEIGDWRLEIVFAADVPARVLRRGDADERRWEVVRGVADHGLPSTAHHF